MPQRLHQTIENLNAMYKGYGATEFYTAYNFHIINPNTSIMCREPVVVFFLASVCYLFKYEMGNVETRSGDCTLDKTHKLISDTDYICFAFGYDGGSTTKLTTFKFRTGKASLDGVAKMRLVKVETSPWSEDPNQAVVSFYIEPENGVEYWRAQIFRTENGVVVGRFGVTLNDQEVAGALFNKTNDSLIDKK